MKALVAISMVLMVYGFAAAVLFVGVKALLDMGKEKCDFCGDRFRLEDEPLKHGRESITGVPQEYCAHCIQWWEERGQGQEA